MFQAPCKMKAPFARIAYLAVLIAVLSYAFFTLRGPHGIPALLERQRQIQDMQQRNAKLDREIERMRDHIKRLTDNPAQQELEIRDRLKLVKPGEKVYVTGDPAKK
jgi:cell division protein FtsB